MVKQNLVSEHFRGFKALSWMLEHGGKVPSEKILWLCDALSMLNALNE
jgi:hypothetical protein